jgi:hypothetical protein
MSNSEGKEALVTTACSPEPVAKNKVLLVFDPAKDYK